MRAFLLLATLALLIAPGATATAQDPPVIIDPDVEVSPDGCEDCASADLTVAQTEPDNCSDCGGIGVHVGVDHDGQDTTVDARVCRGGFVVICLVDESVTV